MLPLQSVDLAIGEMRFAREKLGMRGGFLRPNPYHGKKTINDQVYEPFWAMAEDLDFCIGFLAGVNKGKVAERLGRNRAYIREQLMGEAAEPVPAGDD